MNYTKWGVIKKDEIKKLRNSKYVSQSKNEAVFVLKLQIFKNEFKRLFEYSTILENHQVQWFHDMKYDPDQYVPE